MNSFPYRAKFEIQDDLCFVSIDPMPTFCWKSTDQREEWEERMGDVMRPYQGVEITPEIVAEIETTVEYWILELLTIGAITNNLPFGLA